MSRNSFSSFFLYFFVFHWKRLNTRGGPRHPRKITTSIAWHYHFHWHESSWIEFNEEHLLIFCLCPHLSVFRLETILPLLTLERFFSRETILLRMNASNHLLYMTCISRFTFDLWCLVSLQGGYFYDAPNQRKARFEFIEYRTGNFNNCVRATSLAHVFFTPLRLSHFKYSLLLIIFLLKGFERYRVSQQNWMFFNTHTHYQFNVDTKYEHPACIHASMPW